MSTELALRLFINVMSIMLKVHTPGYLVQWFCLFVAFVVYFVRIFAALKVLISV